MTVVPNPLPRLTRFRILLILAVVGIAVSAAVPTTLYWTLQRTDLHARWQLESNYARQFGFQMEYVSSLMNGTVYKWNNVTSSFAGNLIGYANENLRAPLAAQLYSLGNKDLVFILEFSKIH
ncbi:hypothetical protein E6H12_11430 [Candidatus Bathyarchaeota archaeon]|nr:MAG: hypothetical protein E6H12_11430 [Candidatus Bathyarchaeota archaeon]